MMHTTRPVRVARASVFAVACLGVSAAGHVWMSGRPVPVTVLAPGFLLVFALALAAAGRPRSYRPIALAMLAGEVGLHLLFSAAQDTGGGTAAMPGMASMPGMTMGGMPGMAPTPTAVGLVPMSAVAGHGAAGMVAVHAAAGLACAWWLHRAERAFFALVSWLLGQAAAVLLPSAGPCRADVVDSRPTALPAYGGRVRCQLEFLGDVLVRRGPPGGRFSAEACGGVTSAGQ